MRIRELWRFAALIALILAALGLALGACMAKKSTDSGRSTATTPETGGTVRPSPNKPPNTPGDSRASSRDAGLETKEAPDKPPPPPGARPRPSKAEPKGHKGMLGQMHLQDGD